MICLPGNPRIPLHSLFTNLGEFNHLEWIEGMNIFINFSSLPPPPSFSKVGTQTLLAYYCRSGIIFYLPMANTWVIKKINNSNQSTFWCLASAISETLYNKRRIHTAKYEILKTVVIQLPKRKVQNKCLAWVRSRDLNLDPPGWWQTSCSLLLWVKQKKTPYESEHSYPKQLHRLT